jgi:hypothetical protein
MCKDFQYRYSGGGTSARRAFAPAPRAIRRDLAACILKRLTVA